MAKEIGNSNLIVSNTVCLETDVFNSVKATSDVFYL